MPAYSIQPFIEHLSSNDLFLLIGSFITSLFISFFTIPRVVSIAKKKSLFDTPNDRTSHIKITPTLGGVALFTSFIITTLLFINSGENSDHQYISAAIILIFFIGMKDDILLMSPLKKLIGQIAASLILIILGDIRLVSLYGFMGIQELSFTSSVFLSLFTYIVIINCINLIDGVDGLASGLAIQTSIIFSLWFISNGLFSNAILTTSLLGGLVPFFIYNVFGKKNKLFMGDTGSLIIGIVTAVLIIRFNMLNMNPKLTFHVSNSPAMSIAIIFIPLYDTLRVFTIRILSRKSPFTADKNHLHHLLLKLGCSHIQTTGILMFINLTIISIAYHYQSLGVLRLTILLLVSGFVFSGALKFLIRIKDRSELLISKKFQLRRRWSFYIRSLVLFIILIISSFKRGL